MTNNQSRGVITTYILVLGAILLLLLSSLLGFVLLQLRQASQKVAWNEALHLAEAGVDYYRWHLRHFPNDSQDGNDWCCDNPPCSACGPYEHSYSDPERKVEGKFSLEIEAKTQCGKLTTLTIVSTGWTDQFPQVKRKVKIKYIRSSVADYAYLLNDNVWAGPDREIKGPYHSNGGIRMDGENNALVTSAKDTWTCTSSFGCDSCPSDCISEGSSCICPGVFTTANGNEELFRYPVPPFDFEGITMDLAEIKDLTKNQGQGIYLPPSDEEGYYVILKKESIDVYEITDLDAVYAYDLEQGWYWEYSLIGEKDEMPQNYSIPADCGLIFVEDNLWVEGETQGKLTMISADLEDPSKETDVWLTGDITYKNKDGSDGFVLLAQRNNLIHLYSPDSMELHGIYIAQIGHFGRNHYPCSYYPNDCLKEYLEMYGSVVSDGRVGTKWTYSWGGIASGYEKRENIYDPQQSYNPPPFLPYTSETFEFKEWEEL
jgi:hypothetical protein